MYYYFDKLLIMKHSLKEFCFNVAAHHYYKFKYNNLIGRAVSPSMLKREPFIK